MLVLIIQVIILLLWLYIRHLLYIKFEDFNINELHHWDIFLLNIMVVNQLFEKEYVISSILFIIINIVAVDDIFQHKDNKSYLKKIAEKFDCYNNYWKK